MVYAVTIFCNQLNTTKCKILFRSFQLLSIFILNILSPIIEYTDEEIAAAKASGTELKYNAMHYGTIDSKIDNIGKYIQLIETESLYNPNEPDLTTAAINDKYLTLKTAQADWNKTDVNLETAKRQRDLVISADNTGLCDIGLGVKKYVKSAFGPDSPEHKSLSDKKIQKKQIGF
ncbi:MAG: hypothetical protein Q7W54_07290 [Bacteroidota bacterium]|nr:hypothetical protein [Bacteroidota bacterium]